MSRQLRLRHLSGVTDISVREYETRHRAIARKAAAEGMVLLRNENDTLPLKEGSSVALYGAGALYTKKGGTGSGDVNQRESVNIYDGLKAAGIHITTEDWLKSYEAGYQEERIKWRDHVLELSEAAGGNLFNLYAGNPMKFPKGDEPRATDADVAIYVISRTSGEGADRKNVKGDFLVTDDEYAFVQSLCNLYNSVILIINSGGLIDLAFTDDFTNIDSILYMSQAGMEGGNALTDVLIGKVNPSGKLTDTWAYSYSDYPGAAEYSTNGASLEYAAYHEDIYVGYRYFDSFNKSVRYGFGFGLSYTKFRITTESVNVIGMGTKDPRVCVGVKVVNVGEKYSGREVVQVYVSCPDGRLAKEHRRLAAFAKTTELAPGEAQLLKIEFSLELCESYSEEYPGYILEEGYYGIWVGNSLGDCSIRGLLRMDHGVVLTQTDHICPLKKNLRKMDQTELTRSTRYKAWVEKAKSRGVPLVNISEAYRSTRVVEYGEKSYTDPEAVAVARSLDIDELIKMTTGDLGRGELHTAGGIVGSSGIAVPGSAAETCIACEDKGIGSMVLSDGPAGLRLDQFYYVAPDGSLTQREFMDKVEDGLFVKEPKTYPDDYKKYYQFCTAFPVGTLLAQTWDPEILYQFGAAVAEEMMEFQTSLWLAPGMNIHRNPLCGRNFEYFSEDPLISGIMAAAITRGVQSKGGCGTTIKHFACNNQEENRMHCDSIVGERALREIYLKGFEICIKESQPMAVMTSYNVVNGVHTANSYDLCTKVLRDEWGFEGLVMTDWCTTEQGEDCTAAGCMRAGNDLVCPGNEKDHANIREELIDDLLEKDEIINCVSRLIKTAWQSNAYLDVPSYTEQFHTQLRRFISVQREQA